MVVPSRHFEPVWKVAAVRLMAWFCKNRSAAYFEVREHRKLRKPHQMTTAVEFTTGSYLFASMILYPASSSNGCTDLKSALRPAS